MDSKNGPRTETVKEYQKPELTKYSSVKDFVMGPSCGVTISFGNGQECIFG